MRLFAFILLFVGSAHANPTIIDFDGAQNPFDPITGNRVMTVPQGFTITNNVGISTGTSDAGGCLVPAPPEPNEPDNYYCTVASPSVPLRVDITESGGQLFDLVELDVYLLDSTGIFTPVDELSFSAWDAGGNLIAERQLLASEEGFGWHTLQFGSEWSGISTLTYNPQAESLESGTFAYLDNITVNVVTAPIPAEIQVKPDPLFNVLHPHHDGRFGPQGITALPDDPINVVVITQSTAVGDPVDLDATDIDSTTLAFGPDGGAINPASTPDFSQDVDSDGLNDAQFEFLTSDSGIQCADVDASLSGELLASGDNFLGTDAITTDCNAQCHN